MNELYVAREANGGTARLRQATPFVAIGTASIIAGGLIAGATARHPTEHEAWAVAFLVLVCGITQIALGLGQSLLATTVPPSRTIIAELVAFNAGCALVLVGTIAGLLLLTEAGSVLLALALVLLFRAVGGAGVQAGWPVNLYRALIAIVLLSIPIGLVLAHLKTS
jgi:hypothetical protein